MLDATAVSTQLHTAAEALVKNQWETAEADAKAALTAIISHIRRSEFEIEYRQVDPNSGPQAFTAAASMWGLSPKDLGREFVSQRRRFRIESANLRAHKLPIIAADVRTGKRFKFAPTTVKAGLPKVNA